VIEKAELLKHHADPAAQKWKFPAAYLGNILLENIDKPTGWF
jgi:hypothetical protein